MKRTALSIAIILIAHMSFGQPEVKLNTQIHALTGKVFKTRANYFKNVFFPEAGTFPNYVVETTTYNKLHQLEHTLAPHLTKKYIRVLRILYGLDITTTPYTIRLIYIPDKAIENTPGVFDFAISAYPIPNNQTVYLLDGSGDFVSQSYGTTAAGLIANYKSTGKIKLNPYGDPGNTTYRDLSFDHLNEDKDAEGITFSFQEINDFVRDAPNVYITNIAEKDEIHGNNFHKHAIAISRHNPSAAIENYEFAANLGALCPLRCKTLELATSSVTPVGTFVDPFIYINVR